jgi:hypothetical protein
MPIFSKSWWEEVGAECPSDVISVVFVIHVEFIGVALFLRLSGKEWRCATIYIIYAILNILTRQLLV